MGIVAAVPFHLEQGGEIFKPKESGFHLINNSLGELGKKTAAGRSDMIGLDAIPSCIAHLKKMHSDMNKRGIGERYKEEQWRKVMVVYVLSKYRAYDITIDTISEKNCSQLVWNIFGKELARETGMEDCIYMLQLQGEDVAVFDSKGYLLPVAQFPSDIEMELGENCINGLEEYEKGVLLAFLQGLLQNTMEYQCYIVDFINSLKANGAIPADNWDKVQAFQESMDEWVILGNKQANEYFYRIPDSSVHMPPAFHSKLVLASTERREGNIKGFGKDCTFQFTTSTEDGPLLFSGFLPLSEKMVDFLENNNDVNLESVYVDDSGFAKEHKLLVKLSFMVKGRKIILKKCYKQEDILYANSVPMISLFPYVDLPEDCWKCYYLVLISNEGTFDGNVSFLNGFEQIEGKNIDLAEASWSRSTEAGSDEDRQTWYYALRERMPSYVKLCKADFGQKDKERNATKAGGYLGCICTGKPEISQKRTNRNYVWALDMGTRNTIVAYKEKDSQSISYRLSRDQIYGSLLLGKGDKDRNFARECYAPVQEINGSFPTMARIYKEGYQNGGEKCYEHGCALFPDLELIEVLLNKDNNWDDAAILTDIKFGHHDDKHKRALQIFLFNMLWLGSLECIINGAEELDVWISYPRTDIKARIERTWDVVKSMMQKVSNIKIRNNYCSEAEANARYLQKVMRGRPAQSIASQNIFGICDIGDGTSDFNLYLGTSNGDKIPGRIQFSMRYAGGDIVVDTIMKFSERRQEYFRRLWNIPEDEGERSKDEHYEKADNLLITYSKLLKSGKKYDGAESGDETQVKNVKDEGIGIGRISEGSRESKRNIILTLIENVGLRRNLIISPDTSINDFVAVLAFKYWNLFHVYGEMLKRFTPHGAVSFKLFIYGGGRKALEFATGEPLEKFTETEFGRDIVSFLSLQAYVEKAGFSLYLEENTSQKIEVVEGMLEGEGPDTIKSKAYSSRKEIDEYFRNKCNEELPSETMDQSQIDVLLEEYQSYIQDVEGKQYFDLYAEGKVNNIYEAVSVGRQGIRRSELEEENYSLFRKSAENLWIEITTDNDNPSCLWKVLFYTKMSNYLLMENIF